MTKKPVKKVAKKPTPRRTKLTADVAALKKYAPIKKATVKAPRLTLASLAADVSRIEKRLSLVADDASKRLAAIENRNAPAKKPDYRELQKLLGHEIGPSTAPMVGTVSNEFVTTPGNWGSAGMVLAGDPVASAVRGVPPATPEERRAELERRGLKSCVSHKGMLYFTTDGYPRSAPGAWLDGYVHGSATCEAGDVRTTTMPEFCAALDAVGLVAQPAPVTPEERRAELERRGLKPWRGARNDYSLNGIGYELPSASIFGAVRASDSTIYTRTLPAFCDALDAVRLVAKPATPEERAALCEAWGATYDELLTADHSWGLKCGADMTLPQLEDLMWYLPYTREWREKVARELLEGKATVSRHGPSMAFFWGDGGYPTHRFWANPDDGKVYEISEGPKMVRDRAAWLAFIRKHAPAKPAPVDPLDLPLTREAFDTECVSRSMERKCGYYKMPSSEHYCWWELGNATGVATFTAPSDVKIDCHTLRELRAVLDRELPSLCGDGPFTVAQLNAAGIECRTVIARDGPVTMLLKYCKDSDGDDCDSRWADNEMKRDFILWLAKHPRVNPAWAAKVRKALGVSND